MALTLKQIKDNVNTPSAKYWAERALDNEGKFYDLTTVQLKDLSKEYRKASNAIETQVKALYANGTVKDGKLVLSFADANKYNRLTKALENINAAVKTLGVFEESLTTKHLESTYKDGYLTGMFTIQEGVGVGTTFGLLPDAFIKQAISTPWSGLSFSDRIWNNKEKLSRVLKQDITQELIRGEGVQKASRRVRDTMGSSYKEAERLVRTETNHVVNASNLTAYDKMSWVEEYEYIAELDERTSQICSDLDGSIHKKGDAVAGVNYPPMHPNCRSTTAVHFPQNKDILGRKIFNADGQKYLVPKGTDYDTWLKKVTDGAKTTSKPL